MGRLSIDYRSTLYSSDLRDDHLLMARLKSGNIELWHQPAETEVELDSSAIAIDWEQGIFYHRDRQDRLWCGQMDNPDILMWPQLPTNGERMQEGVWNNMGKMNRKVNVREARHTFLIMTLEHLQSGASAAKCEQIAIPVTRESSEGLRYTLHHMGMTPTRRGQEQTDIEDLHPLLDEIMLSYGQELWQGDTSMVLVIGAIGEEERESLFEVNVAELRCGNLCACQMQDLSRDILRQWTGPLKHDSHKLSSELQGTEIIGGVMIIPGIRHKQLPQMHVMLGTVDTGVLDEPEVPAQRIIN